MKFVYTRKGGPLLDWSGASPPSQSRAGETRQLGDFHPSHRQSAALRRYGGKEWDRPYNPVTGGQAISYENDRQLGALDIPRPGAPEVISGYEAPQPGAAVIHLGGASGAGSYMPAGAIRSYGQTSIGADDAPKAFDRSLIRKGAALAAAYHGVKRHNGSVLWGLLWGLAAMVAPLDGVIVPAIGIAQGFASPRFKANPAKIRRGGKSWKKKYPKQARRLARKRKRKPIQLVWPK